MAGSVLISENTRTKKIHSGGFHRMEGLVGRHRVGLVLGSAQGFTGSLNLVLPSCLLPMSVCYVLCVCTSLRRRGKRSRSLLLGLTSNCPSMCDVPEVMEGGAPNTGLGSMEEAFHRRATEVSGGS